MEVTKSSCFGTISFSDPETVVAPSDRPGQTVTVTCHRGEWRPSERLANLLPDGFAIPIEYRTSRDGLRRIIPLCGLESLIDLGAVGGLAVLQGIYGLDPHLDYSYRAMLVIHQYVRGRAYFGTRGMREHLTRQFGFSRDLHLRRLSRCVDSERDVLPDDVSHSTAGKEGRMTVGQLTELGRQAARADSCPNPTSKQAIAYGVFEVAKRNPIEVEPERLPALVRMALFDSGSAENSPSREIVEIVSERFREILHPHLSDSREVFAKWLFGSGNSIVKQIAQQKKKRGGALQASEVRQALLQLGWEAYEYVGQCIHAFMRTIANSMPDPLNEAEWELFARMYESQPCLGGLPLPLLAERADFLKHAVLAIWNDPESLEHEHVLHTLLYYYAEMARTRRAADRRSKQQCQGGARARTEANGAMEKVADEAGDSHIPHGSRETRDAADGRYAGSTAFVDSVHSVPSSPGSMFDRVGEHIREVRAIECNAGCEVWAYGLEDQSEQLVAIDIRCECGRVATSLRLPRHEFEALAKDALQ